MKKTMVLGSAALLALAAIGAEPKCPLEGEWKLVKEVSDEFDGKGLVYSKWRDMNPDFTGRRGTFCFARSNVAVKDGELQLTARELTKEEKDNDLRGFMGEKWATGVVKSWQKVKYGYFEARIKSMKASVCNAFWLYDPLGGTNAKNLKGDFSEEIDIMEVFGEPTAKAVEHMWYGTCHRFETPYVEGIANKYEFKLPKKGVQQWFGFDFWKDYHTYGLLWTEDEITWFVDGKKMGSRPNDFFKRPLHVMVNCEVMPGWGGAPAEGQLPAVMHVDYVRVWQMQRQEGR